MVNKDYAGHEHIYEPLNEYKRVFAKKHEENIDKLLDKLIQTSQVSKEANRALVKDIRKQEKELESIKKSRNSQRALKTFSIVMIVASILAVVIGIAMLVNGFSVGALVALILGAILAPLLIVYIVKVINPKIKALSEKIVVLEKKIIDLINEAWDMMKPLNDLFTDQMSTELFNQTMPSIQLDKMFESKRLDHLVSNYGYFSGNDPDRSTLAVKSGILGGNPFYIAKDLVHTYGLHTYSGSITIHWTTTGRNGRTQHHSQVLTATIERPGPFYNEQSYVVFGSEAAPDLSFTRYDSDAEHLSQKQIDKHVSRQMKRVQKKAEKDMRKGKTSMTALGNTEFEILFGAHNRNNEVQFRLLFTTLAQKELLKLMKDKEIGFGDNFDYIKDKMINYIFPEHLGKINLSVPASYYHDYDIDRTIERFKTYNKSFFKYIYFAIAPILAIPLFQQHKPHQFIYKDLYDSYVSFYEHEQVCNMMNQENIVHPLSGTRNILKTSLVKSGEFCDTINVVAYGYETIPQVTYVRRRGNDGRTHSIPVHWTQYVPVERETEISIDILDAQKEETHTERIRRIFEGIQERKLPDQQIFRYGAMMAHIVKNKEDRVQEERDASDLGIIDDDVDIEEKDVLDDVDTIIEEETEDIADEVAQASEEVVDESSDEQTSDTEETTTEDAVEEVTKEESNSEE